HRGCPREAWSIPSATPQSDTAWACGACLCPPDTATCPCRRSSARPACVRRSHDGCTTLSLCPADEVSKGRVHIRHPESAKQNRDAQAAWRLQSSILYRCVALLRIP